MSNSHLTAAAVPEDTGLGVGPTVQFLGRQGEDIEIGTGRQVAGTWVAAHLDLQEIK